MAKRREVDRGKLADIDEVLLERAAGPEEPVSRPALARPAAKASARRRKRPAASRSRDG